MMTTPKAIIISSFIIGLSIITGQLLTHQKYSVTGCADSNPTASCYTLTNNRSGELYRITRGRVEKASWGNFDVE